MVTGAEVVPYPSADVPAQVSMFIVKPTVHKLRVKQSSRSFFLIVEHLALDKAEPGEEVPYLVLAVAYECEDCLYPMIFSGLGKLFDEFLSNSLAAEGWVNSNDFNTCDGPG